MKIAVIGAGIIGVTTAYELACDGHEVTVLEQRGTAAEESSFANAGLLTTGCLAAWSGPAMPTRLMQQMFGQHAALKVMLPLSAKDLSWVWQWYRARQRATHSVQCSQLRQLALYSRERLHQITKDLNLEYQRSDGCMVLLRSERDKKTIQPGLQMLRDSGVTFKELTPPEARKIESALNPDTTFIGAIYLPNDEVGNCRQFALMLKNAAQRLNVKFSFNTTVTQIRTAGGIAIAVGGENTARQYDACVVCAGLASVRLLAPLGLKIPLLAVHGYSVSAAVREPLNAPRSAVIDERHKVIITRLGNRVRVAGSAEFGGSSEKIHAHSLKNLYQVLHDWFPGAARLSGGVQQWRGASPMLPDGQPMVGASGIAGLWLNLGHGFNGWTLSCGSARVLADLINGGTPSLDVGAVAIGHAVDLKSHAQWVDTIRA
jgi:D-amino-acid dehydrogenase